MKKYSPRAMSVLEERSKAFRIIYDTILNVYTHYDKEKVLNILIKNLYQLTNAHKVVLFVREDNHEYFEQLEYEDSNEMKIKKHLIVQFNIANDIKLLYQNDILLNYNPEECQILPIKIKEEDRPHVFHFGIIDRDELIAFGFIHTKNEKLKIKDIISAYLGLVNAILTRLEAFSDINENKHLLETLINYSPAGILLVDENRNIVKVNSAMEKLTGYSRAELIGQQCSKIKCSQSKATCPIFDLNQTEDHKELVILNAEKKEISIIKDATAVTISGKRYVLETIVDISEQKKMQEIIRHSEQRFKDISLSMADWIWETDQEGTYTYVSGNVQSILGYDPDYFIGKTPFDFMTNHDRKIISNKFLNLVKFKKTITDLENWNIKADGKKICLLTNGIPIIDSQGNLQGYRGVNRDITEKKKAREREKQLQKELSLSSKLAAIGELAAGVAHEINNPLAIICGHLEMSSKKLEQQNLFNDDLKKHYHTMKKSIIRISNIVNGLRNLSRSESDDFKPTDVMKVLTEITSLVKMIYEKENVKIKLSSNSETALINGNASQLEQIFINIISNAKDALVNTTKEKIIDIKVNVKNHHVTIKICDNGEGISEENLEKIYDSFFTTKDVGKGTGLGLSIARSLILSMDGDIKITSAEKKGTTAQITFPETLNCNIKIEDERILNNDDKIDKNEVQGHILIVDDEESIRDILSNHLKIFPNLTIEQSQNGLQALEKLKTKKFDYLVTDVKMPIMTGLELIEHLQNSKSHIPKTLLMTGILDISCESFPQNVQVLKKPFNKEEFLKQIKKL